jgi:hypothetical protein
MKGDMTTNIRILKSQLSGFTDASKILKELYNKDINKFASLVFPDVVLTAFACEIAIKGIYNCEYKHNLKSHDLLYLFNKLDEATRKEIKQGINEFDSLLEQNKDIFNEWRYIYEKEGKKHVGIQFLDNFLKALCQKSDSYKVT